MDDATPIDLDAIQKRRAAITPEPWEIIGGGEYISGPDIVIGSDGGVRREDAEFIAHAPEDIDALVVEVANLRARIAAVQLASATPEDVDSVEWAAGQDARLLSLYRRALDRIDIALTDEQGRPYAQNRALYEGER